MTDQARVTVARTVAATSCALAVGSLVLALAAGDVVFWWRSFSGVNAGIALALGVFVWLVIPRQPRNAAVWAMAASIGAAINAATLALVPLLIVGDPFVVLDARWVPADTPELGWVQAVGAVASVPGLFVPLSLGVMLFPDGTLPSRRWRPVAVAGIAGIAVLAVTHGWWYRPSNTSRAEPPIIVVSGSVMLIVIAISVIGFVGRLRRSSGTRRLQFKWVAWGTGIGAGVFGGFFFVPDSQVYQDATALIALLGAVGWSVCYGIAVGRYRLYGIDVVISRTLVYASLAVLIAGVYVAVVVALGAAVGGSSLWLSMLATAIVATSFEPARARLQRWANRLVYGHRATPYEILGDLTRQLAVVERGDDLLQRLASQLWAGTAARRVTIWLRDGGALHPAVVAPAAGGPDASAGSADRPGHVVPIEHDGEVLGHLSLEEDPVRTLSAADARLAHDLARSAALVVHKRQLDRDLTATATEIAESRRRLIDAQDDELRRLERELNTTVEQDAVALKAQIGVAERVAAGEGCDRVATLLSQLSAGAQEAIDQIRSLARGIYPPLLDAEGLAAAIAALAADSPLDTRVTIDIDRRFSADIEGAVYFCVSEALTNACKHARGPLSITVVDREHTLTFAVTDSGPGFAPDQIVPGSGLQNMRDRLDALGGQLAVESQPGAPTTVTGALPVGVLHAAVAMTDHRQRDRGAIARDR
jgi:signal transduction histidine kinase